MQERARVGKTMAIVVGEIVRFKRRQEPLALLLRICTRGLQVINLLLKTLILLREIADDFLGADFDLLGLCVLGLPDGSLVRTARMIVYN